MIVRELVIGQVVVSRPEWLLIGTLVSVLIVGITLWRSSSPLLGRIGLMLSRILIVAAISMALSLPVMLMPIQSPELLRVNILYDNSSSMDMFDIDLSTIQSAIGTATDVRVIAQDEQSPLISMISGAIQTDGIYLLVSDGQATDGDDFSQIVAQTNAKNATIYTLELDEKFTDMSVVIDGPHKTVIGATNTYAIRIFGNTDQPGTLKVSIDDQLVLETDQIDQVHTISKAFYDLGSVSINASIHYDTTRHINDEFFLTTSVMPKSPILYLGEDTRVKQLLDELFDVHQVSGPLSSIEQLDSYAAIITHDRPADMIQHDNLVEFVASGNGLAIIGGTSSFHQGGYDSSSFAPLLPVRSGRGKQMDTMAIVLIVDVSYTIANIDDLASVVAYRIVKDLGNENLIGVVAFHEEAFVVSPLVQTGLHRAEVLDKLSRIHNQPRGTRTFRGIQAAYEMLADHGGAKVAILIGDGQMGGDNDGPRSAQLVRDMRQANIQFHSIGVGEDEDLHSNILRGLAQLGGGQYVEAKYTNLLTLQFGRARDTPPPPTFGLFMQLDNHPITLGLSTLTARLNNINPVIPKPGALLLMTTTQGDPALTIWRYGLGRVGTWTAFTGNNELGDLLYGNNAAALMRFFSWAAGDPQRKITDTLTIENGRTGLPITIVARTDSLERLADIHNISVSEITALDMRMTSPGEYRGVIQRYDQPGNKELFNQHFSVNYPLEYQYPGQSSVVEQIAAHTGGKHLKVEQLDQLRDMVIHRMAHSRTPVSYTWLLLTVALVIFTLEILTRKILEHRRNQHG